MPEVRCSRPGFAHWPQQLASRWRRSAHRDSSPWRYRNSTSSAAARGQPARRNRAAAGSHNIPATDTSARNPALSTTSHNGRHARFESNDHAAPRPGGRLPIAQVSQPLPQPGQRKGPHREWTSSSSTFSSSHKVFQRSAGEAFAVPWRTRPKNLGASVLLPRGGMEVSNF